MTKQYFFPLLAALFLSGVSGLSGRGPTQDAPKFVPLKTNTASGDPTLNASSFSVTPRSMAPKIGEAFKDCAECPDLVLISSGNYLMGGKHAISIDRNLAVGKFEITQKQWRSIMSLPSMINPTRFAACGMNCSAEQVGWHYANVYITELNKKTGLKFRMFTEAVWEYAARAGTDNKYGFGNDERALLNYAWLYENGGDPTHKVGLKKPNLWGPHDIHGNVSEWTQDCYANKHSSNLGDGNAVILADCGQRVARGGTWRDAPHISKATMRNSVSPSFKIPTLGFRVVRNVALLPSTQKLNDTK